MARKPFYGQTGADSELTARLRKLQEASQVPPEPEVVEKTGRSYIDNIVQRRANAGINPKQRDLEIEDYTYIQPDRNLRQQVPPSRMITNPEEMEERLQAIARNYFPADDKILSAPYARGRIDFTPREEVSRGEEQDFMGARQQDIRRFKENIDPHLSKANQESLADDLISMRFKDVRMNTRGRVVGDKGYTSNLSTVGFQEPNTMSIFTGAEEFYPKVMAHEYRHFTGSEEEHTDYGNRNDELFNRLLDTYTSQTPVALKDSVKMLAYWEKEYLKNNKERVDEQKPNLNVDEKVDELQKIIDSLELDDSIINLPQKLTEILENSYYSDRFNDIALKRIKEKYEPSPFLTELLEAQEDRRLADVKK